MRAGQLGCLWLPDPSVESHLERLPVSPLSSTRARESAQRSRPHLSAKVENVSGYAKSAEGVLASTRSRHKSKVAAGPPRLVRRL